MGIIDTSDTVKSITSLGVAGGIIWAVIKRKRPLVIFAYAMGTGLVALATATAIEKLTK